MSHCTDQISVLKDWTSAHALYDPTGDGEQPGIRHLNHHIPARAVIQRVKTCDFDVEVLDLISLYIT